MRSLTPHEPSEPPALIILVMQVETTQSYSLLGQKEFHHTRALQVTSCYAAFTPKSGANFSRE